MSSEDFRTFYSSLKSPPPSADSNWYRKRGYQFEKIVNALLAEEGLSQERATRLTANRLMGHSFTRVGFSCWKPNGTGMSSSFPPPQSTSSRARLMASWSVQLESSFRCQGSSGDTIFDCGRTSEGDKYGVPGTYGILAFALTYSAKHEGWCANAKVYAM